MSFNIFKHQVKYCLLNTEDSELNKLKDKREKTEFINDEKTVNHYNLKQKNEEFFNLSSKLSSEVFNDEELNKKLNQSEKIEMNPQGNLNKEKYSKTNLKINNKNKKNKNEESNKNEISTFNSTSSQSKKKNKKSNKHNDDEL